MSRAFISTRNTLGVRTLRRYQVLGEAQRAPAELPPRLFNATMVPYDPRTLGALRRMFGDHGGPGTDRDFSRGGFAPVVPNPYFVPVGIVPSFQEGSGSPAAFWEAINQPPPVSAQQTPTPTAFAPGTPAPPYILVTSGGGAPPTLVYSNQPGQFSVWDQISQWLTSQSLIGGVDNIWLLAVPVGLWLIFRRGK